MRSGATAFSNRNMSAEPVNTDVQPEALSRRTAAGALWVGAGGAIEQMLGFISGLIVASYLMPEQYGTAAMALVVVSFATIFVTFGLAPAIVSGRMSGERQISSAHWLVTSGGILLMLLTCAIAPLAARFFQNSAVAPILMVSALGLALGAWTVVPQARLEAAGRFDVVALVSITAQGLASASAAIMAVLGAGVWALIVPAVAGAGIRAVALTAASRLDLRPRFALGDVRPFMRECAHVVTTSFADYIFFNADKIIVGRLLGEAPLGRYTFANSLVGRAVLTVPRSLAKPLLTSMGQLREDPARLDRAIVRTTVAIARVTFPAAFFGALLAPEFVVLVIGRQWAGAADLLRIFFVVSAVQSIAYTSGWIWLALGRSQLLLIWTVVSNLLLLGVYYAGALAGSPEAVAIAMGLYAYAVVTPALAWVMKRVCHLPLAGLGRALLLVLRDVAAGAVAISLVGALLDRLSAPVGVTLAAQAVAGTLAYSMMFRFVATRELCELIDALPRRLAWLAARVLHVPQSVPMAHSPAQGLAGRT